MGMWVGFFLYSERAGGPREPLAFPPWNSQAAHPIPAVRRNAGMQRGEGGGVGRTEGEDGGRNPAECWNAAGIPGPVRSQDTNLLQMGKSSRLTSPFLQVRELHCSSSIYYHISKIFFCNVCSLINDPLAAVSLFILFSR
jgi:hypothetical protein